MSSFSLLLTDKDKSQSKPDVFLLDEGLDGV